MLRQLPVGQEHIPGPREFTVLDNLLDLDENVAGADIAMQNASLVSLIVRW